MVKLPNASPLILLVDDDEDLLLLLSIKLKREGFSTQSAFNAQNLDEVIHLSHPDLILLDIHMQGEHGGDLCKKLKSQKETCDIPILLFSANHDLAAIAKSCGANGFLAKPLDVKMLKEKMNDVIGMN